MSTHNDISSFTLSRCFLSIFSYLSIFHLNTVCSAIPATPSTQYPSVIPLKSSTLGNVSICFQNQTSLNFNAETATLTLVINKQLASCGNSTFEASLNFLSSTNDSVEINNLQTLTFKFEQNSMSKQLNLTFKYILLNGKYFVDIYLIQNQTSKNLTKTTTLAFIHRSQFAHISSQSNQIVCDPTHNEKSSNIHLNNFIDENFRILSSEGHRNHSMVRFFDTCNIHALPYDQYQITLTNDHNQQEIVFTNLFQGSEASEIQLSNFNDFSNETVFTLKIIRHDHFLCQRNTTDSKLGMFVKNFNFETFCGPFSLEVLRKSTTDDHDILYVHNLVSTSKKLVLKCTEDSIDFIAHFHCIWLYVGVLLTSILVASCLLSVMFVSCCCRKRFKRRHSPVKSPLQNRSVNKRCCNDSSCFFKSLQCCSKKKNSYDERNFGRIVIAGPHGSGNGGRAEDYYINQTLSWKEVHLQWEGCPPTKEMGKVLLLYSPDCKYFCDLQTAFKSFLTSACHTKVLDLFEDGLMREYVRDPESWLSNLCDSENFKVIVVCSEGAFKREQALVNQQVLNIPDNETLDGLFSSALKFLLQRCDAASNIPSLCSLRSQASVSGSLLSRSTNSSDDTLLKDNALTTTQDVKKEVNNNGIGRYEADKRPINDSHNDSREIKPSSENILMRQMEEMERHDRQRRKREDRIRKAESVKSQLAIVRYQSLSLCDDQYLLKSLLNVHIQSCDNGGEVAKKKDKDGKSLIQMPMEIPSDLHLLFCWIHGYSNPLRLLGKPWAGNRYSMELQLFQEALRVARNQQVTAYVK